MSRWAKSISLFPGARFQLKLSILQCRKGTACQKCLTAKGLADLGLELRNLGASSVIDSTFLDYCFVFFPAGHHQLGKNTFPKDACVLHAGRAVLQPVRANTAHGQHSPCRRGSGGSTFHMLPHCLLSLLCPNVCHCRLGCSKMERGLQLCCVSAWFCHVELLSDHMLW